MDILQIPRFNRVFKCFIFAGDVAVITLVFTLLYTLWGKYEGHYPISFSIEMFCSLLGCCYLSCNLLSQILFTNMQVPSYRIVLRVFKNVAIFAIASFVILGLTHHFYFSNRFMVVYFLGCFVALSIFRLTLRLLLKIYNSHSINRLQVVMVGGTSNVADLALQLHSDVSSRIHVAGYFSEHPSHIYADEFAHLGHPDQVIAYLKKHPEVRQLYCALPSAQSALILPIIKYCEQHVIHFYSVPNVSNYLRHPMHFEMMGTVPVLSLRREPLLLRENRLLKRLFDVCFSTLFLVTLFPLIFLIFGFLIKKSSPGPIFFRQKRNGINGKEFWCYKFRSMRQSADADTKQATQDDPRKTRVGELMRRTSIDELPQFINVFLGDMSVVGPRPHMVKHTEEYGAKVDHYMVRHFIKPGVTGWAQVTGFRGETKTLQEMEGRIQADLWYLEHWNFMLDLYIIYKTVANGVKGDKQAF